ncbi:MAG: DegT/DnrJ/EryC1/StrS aminotransferase family protein [Candidatus Aenigmarchaeota archaeon]|nr:DegT/DnrJ/EryC1/StrS aminotransferase family protein [Candidatus Aenigmarchaeota archaeon]
MDLHVYPPLRCFHTVWDFLSLLSVSPSKFEAAFNQWVKWKKVLYTYMARTGLYHLLIYLKSNYGIKRILIPSYICKEAVHAIKKTGLQLVFVDNNLETLGIDSKHIVADKNDAILWVNYFDLKSEPSEELLKNGAIIIEDNASYFMQPSRYADFTLYSFGKGKEFSTSGGGAVVVNNKKYDNFVRSVNLTRPDLFTEMCLFFEYATWKVISNRCFYKILRKIKISLFGENRNTGAVFQSDINGLNYAMPTISKKFAYKQFTKMEKLKSKSKILWELFVEKIKDLKKIKILVSKGNSNFFSVNLLVKNRDRIKSLLENKGIFASLPWPYHLGVQSNNKNLQNSKRIFSDILQIKIDPTYMKTDDIEYIAENFRKIYKMVV